VLCAKRALVVVVDRDAARVAATVADLQAQGHAVEGRVLNVTNMAAVQDLVADLDSRVRVHGVVNAAGILQVGTIADVSEADWDRVVDVNLKGVYIVCRAVLPALVRHGKGAIVNVSSLGGRTKALHGAPNYVASKAGVIGLTMSLAAQNAAAGIRVNCVAPGMTETQMIAILSDDQRAASIAGIPMRRFGEPREVAHVIATLLSDEWSYVTGQTINVNGGAFMQ
jgi:3-oxoacyl-[acyl-carrier protein] reductase